MPDLTQYVVIFVFDGAGHVLLIHKNRPEWQKGKINGIGGHIEPGETPVQAMVRELKEETGLEVSEASVREFAVLNHYSRGGYVHFGRVFVRQLHFEQTTDEAPVILPVSELWKYPVLNNLHWMIPMALHDDVQCGYVINDYS